MIEGCKLTRKIKGASEWMVMIASSRAPRVYQILHSVLMKFHSFCEMFFDERFLLLYADGGCRYLYEPFMIH